MSVLEVELSFLDSFTESFKLVDSFIKADNDTIFELPLNSYVVADVGEVLAVCATFKFGTVQGFKACYERGCMTLVLKGRKSIAEVGDSYGHDGCPFGR